MNIQEQLVYEFSGFRLDPGQRMLLRNGQLVILAPKVFDTLLLLVKNSGRILDKDELMRSLWPESFVEEGNLTQNIFIVRKVLGDDQTGAGFIQTIPRRGYRFMARVKQVKVSASVCNLPPPSPPSLSGDYWSRHNPFRGLRVFEPEDSWLFFGRDAETKDVLARLERSPALVVIGNSGCGKSSLIRAGLIPALRGGHFRLRDTPVVSWRVALVHPSAAPFDYLAEVLPGQLAPELSLRDRAEFAADCRSKLPLGGEVLRDAISVLANAASQKGGHPRILLVVDQFEELFSIASRQIRERYIDGLLAASRWDCAVPVHLVLVLRADSYSYCLEHPGLSHCLETNLYNVPRMSRSQLYEAIEKRLMLAGANAEFGLIDSVLDDAATDRGDLALLEYLLTQLWKNCGGFGCTLTNAAYAAIGWVRRALSTYADRIHNEIVYQEQKELMQRIFLELVHLTSAPQSATQRPVGKAEVFSLTVPSEVAPLVARQPNNFQRGKEITASFNTRENR